MYTKHTIVRRPPLGWLERRRYFRRLFEQRPKALTTEERPKLPPPDEPDEKD